MKRQLVSAGLLLFLTGTLSAGIPKTTHVFPQVADGGGIRTVFLVMNQSDEDIDISIEVFGSDGVVLTLTTDGETTNKLERTVAANSSARLATAGTAPGVTAGWGVVSADRPVGAQALFEIRTGNNLVTQAAVDSADSTRRAEGFVEVVTGTTSTGYAIANPGDGPISIQITVRQGANVLGVATVPLAASNQLAEFINGRFPNIGNVPSATVEFFGTGQFALVVLQQTGLVIGSLPSVPKESS